MKTDCFKSLKKSSKQSIFSKVTGLRGCKLVKRGANWLFCIRTSPVDAFVKVGLWCLQKKKDCTKTRR